MYHIIIQFAQDNLIAPKKTLLRQWAKKILQYCDIKSTELTLRIVDVDEMTTLNKTYRKKTGPTNVLSFPFEMPKEVKLAVPILGDIVICAEVVNREANEQHKENHAYWAHMITHGILHCLGYDHETDQEAQKMESLESNIMQALHFDNPYENHHD